MSNGPHPSQRRSLVDSLLAIIGHVPDSIRIRPLLRERGLTRGGYIQLKRAEDEDALMHELGHFWSERENPMSQAAADSVRIDPFTFRGRERLADAYAGLLRHQTGRLRELPSDSRLLQTLRAASSKRAKQGRTE